MEAQSLTLLLGPGHSFTLYCVRINMSRFQGASGWVCICLFSHPNPGMNETQLGFKTEKEIQVTTLSVDLSFQSLSSCVASEVGDRDPSERHVEG